MKAPLLPCILVILCLSCANDIYLHRITTFLNAHTAQARGRFLAADYHSFFLEKKGPGKGKAEAVHSFLDWDAPLHPDITILTYSNDGPTWKVEFNEQNDFSKLIGFPGWKGTEWIRFNGKKKISEVTYVPNEDNPDYKKWLEPAVTWLQKNRPGELDEVYKQGRLVQNPEAARRWVTLLSDWRKQSRR